MGRRAPDGRALRVDGPQCLQARVGDPPQAADVPSLPAVARQLLQPYWRTTTSSHYILNSILVTSAITVCVVFTSSILGYVFAKTRFVGRDLIFVAFLATMALPFEVLAIPLLLMARSAGAVDQLWGLAIPVHGRRVCDLHLPAVHASIPDDYLDAGRVDGLGQFGSVPAHRVADESARPVAAVAILSFLYNWDQLFWPLVLISSDTNKTVPLGIVDLSTQFGPIYDLTMAASTMTIVPVLVVFLLFRRHFIQGMMMSGLKG